MQTFMRQFTVRQRMIGAIAVVLALLGAVGGAGLWGMWRLSNVADEFTERAYQETVTLSQLKASMGAMTRHEKDMIIAYEKPDLVVAAKARWKTEADKTAATMGTLLAGRDESRDALVTQMQERLKAYMAAIEPVSHQLESGGYETATIANRMLGRAHEQHKGLTELLDQVEASLGEDVAALSARSDSASQQTLWVFGVALALAALIVVPTTLANMHSICAPVDRARQLADAIAEGDLTRTVQATGRDEIAELLRALGRMQASLSRIVGDVRNSSDSIGTASQEIATGNQDLSSRTEQTASNLQQTAASMEQLSSTVRQSADAARQASARMLVWKAMPSMTPMMSPIFWLLP